MMNHNYTDRLILGVAMATTLTGCNSSGPAEEKRTDRPNILLIVADDLGYTDISPYGGNINTPVISALAKEGLSFSNFHAQPTCSPTRASLLTGCDNHVAGMGIMAEVDYPRLHALNLPGYTGALSNNVVTLPEVLRSKGYHTYMTGKWHLGEGPGKDPFDRGFEETFILNLGGGSHWSDQKPLSPLQHMEYTRNGKVVALPGNFYSSNNYTDSLLQFIGKNKADGKPFFAYLAYTAVHDPLHVPADYIAKYKGRFARGWDSLWTNRLKSLQSLGLIPATVTKFSKSPAIPAWDKLDPKQKQLLERDMEVYAGMLEYLDMSIGRVLEYLKRQGMYDNTMIIFMSDNGANGAMATAYPGNENGKYLSTFNNDLNNRGLINSYVETGAGWAQASSSPFRYFKSFTSEGGIRVPLIIKLPGPMRSGGTWNSSFVHVTDLMPTVLELAGVTHPATFNGKAVSPGIGKSILSVLKGDSASVHTGDGYGWELFEMKAYIRDNWKILRLPKPMGTGDWQLFDLSSDPCEAEDLSARYPEIREKLIIGWKNYASVNEVFDHNGHFDSIYRKNYIPEERD